MRGSELLIQTFVDKVYFIARVVLPQDTVTSPEVLRRDASRQHPDEGLVRRREQLHLAEDVSVEVVRDVTPQRLGHSFKEVLRVVTLRSRPQVLVVVDHVIRH